MSQIEQNNNTISIQVVDHSFGSLFFLVKYPVLYFKLADT